MAREFLLVPPVFTHGVRENLRHAAPFVFLGGKNLLTVRTNTEETYQNVGKTVAKLATKILTSGLFKTFRLVLPYR